MSSAQGRRFVKDWEVEVVDDGALRSRRFTVEALGPAGAEVHGSEYAGQQVRVLLCLGWAQGTATVPWPGLSPSRV